MIADVLPNRRIEGWRWSDLSAAFSGKAPPLAPGDRHVIARLAEGAGDFSKVAIGRGEKETIRERLGAQPLDARALEIDVAPGGVVTLITSQIGGDIALAHRKVRLAQGAAFRQVVLGDGARFARVETEIEVVGPGASVSLSGAYLAAKGRHVDLTSQVILKAEGAQVRQLVRGVARKGGRGVFQGRFKVERAAQKTDAQMANNALLLEEGAEVFAKPELEIYADNVQCAHGNTSGQLNEDAVFYLRQRGLPETQARALITRAFLIEALPDWLDADTRAELEAHVDRWLGAAS